MALEKCRTCYNDELPENLIRLDIIDLLYSISIGTKLNQCIPELELNVTKEKICKNCRNLLTTIYNFRKMCLQTEAAFKNKNLDVNNTIIKSEPSEVFIPMDIVKTEISNEELVIHDLTGDENVSRNSYASEADNLHTFETDVITGDISVGFEITNAKKIHNTVSVSFTTNSEKTCRFQAESCSDLESSLQCKNKKIPPKTETIEEQSHITLGTTSQLNHVLSDAEIIAKLLKKRPSLRRKNIMNAVVRLQKLPKSVLVTLSNSKRNVYICNFCGGVLINRTRLRKHNSQHLRRIAYAQLENLEKSKKKKKYQRLPRSPHQQTKIKVEVQETPISYEPVLEFPSSSRQTCNKGYKKSKTNIFDVSSPTKKPDKKVKRSSWNSEPVNSRTYAKSKTKQNSHINEQHLHKHIKTEVLEPSEAVMKCEFCDITFCSINIFNLHMSLHPNENSAIKEHVCEICKASFNLRVQLNGHMSIHSRKRPRKINAKKSKLIASQKRKASQSNVNKSKKPLSDDTDKYAEPNNKQSSNSANRNFRKLDCQMCTKKFESVHHYNAHACLKINETHRMFKCEVCKNHFLGRNAFLEHVKSHLDGFT